MEANANFILVAVLYVSTWRLVDGQLECFPWLQCEKNKETCDNLSESSNEWWQNIPRCSRDCCKCCTPEYTMTKDTKGAVDANFTIALKYEGAISSEYCKQKCNEGMPEGTCWAFNFYRHLLCEYLIVSQPTVLLEHDERDSDYYRRKYCCTEFVQKPGNKRFKSNLQMPHIKHPDNVIDTVTVNRCKTICVNARDRREMCWGFILQEHQCTLLIVRDKDQLTEIIGKDDEGGELYLLQYKCEEDYVPTTTETARRGSSPETTVAMSSSPETTAEISTTPETTTEISSSPETTTEKSSSPETTAEISSTPETTAEVSSTPETTTEISSSPETTTEISSTPETTTEKSSSPETTTEISSTPETTAEVSSTPETTTEISSSPETTAEKSSSPETTAAYSPTAETSRTDATTTTPASTTPNKELCACPCDDDAVKKAVEFERLTPEEKRVVMNRNKEQMQKALTVDPKKTSKARRKRTSASDERTAAKVVGVTLGVILLSVMFSLIVVSDLPLLLRHGRLAWRNVRSWLTS